MSALIPALRSPHTPIENGRANERAPSILIALFPNKHEWAQMNAMGAEASANDEKDKG